MMAGDDGTGAACMAGLTSFPTRIFIAQRFTDEFPVPPPETPPGSRLGGETSPGLTIRRQERFERVARLIEPGQSGVQSRRKPVQGCLWLVFPVPTYPLRGSLVLSTGDRCSIHLRSCQSTPFSDA
jgi:hypothetical protein